MYTFFFSYMVFSPDFTDFLHKSTVPSLNTRETSYRKRQVFSIELLSGSHELLKIERHDGADAW